MITVMSFLYACAPISEGEFAFIDGHRSELSCTDFPGQEGCDDTDEPEDEGPPIDPGEQADPEDCDESMGVRKVVPDNNARAPINASVFVSLIGNGNDEHAVVSLFDASNQEVSGEKDSVCYYHESDTEYHCTYTITPDELLDSNSSYRIRIQGTEYHHDPSWSYESLFNTTSSSTELDSAAPELEILRYEEREPGALDPCDWRGVYKYELVAEIADPQSSQLSILQVFEVDGTSEALVHSIIIPEGETSLDFRQVLNPGTEGNRCYRAFHLDVAGNQSDSSPTVCWE